MSTGVHSDLEALKRFHEHLVRYNQVLAEEFTSIRKHWQSMGDVWRDEKYREFGESLDEVERGIERYLAAAPSHEAHLRKLIEIMGQYLDTRLS